MELIEQVRAAPEHDQIQVLWWLVRLYQQQAEAMLRADTRPGSRREWLDTQAAIDALCERFSDFFDAVLVEVVLDLPRRSRDRRAELRLLAQDTEGTWQTVTLHLSSLFGYRLTEERTSYLVLSDGLRIVLHDRSTLIDLAPETESAWENSEPPPSPQYVVGGECSYEIDATDA